MAKVDGISDINCDPTKKVCTFKASKDVDIKATLDKLVKEGENDLKDWKLK